MRVIELVAGFFAVQHCLIAFTQARACGMTPRQIRWQVTKGAWMEVLEHVYRLAGTPDTFEQRVMAAVLHAGLDALACRFTAAALWGFLGLQAGPDSRLNQAADANEALSLASIPEAGRGG